MQVEAPNHLKLLWPKALCSAPFDILLTLLYTKICDKYHIVICIIL